MIPRKVHFVFGLREQTEPFHVLHSVAIESARRYLHPESIHFHYKELPWGPDFDRVLPHLTLHEVDLVPEVVEANYDPALVPARYRYAHHADFIRLDALIEHGGIYADIDTVFVAEFPDDLFEESFVIGSEGSVRDEHTGELRPSLCNALVMAEPTSPFALRWRDEMAANLNGTWSNHSGFLSQSLTLDLKEKVRVVDEQVFCSFPATPEGLAALLERRSPVAADALSIHLWAHLWWERERTDFSRVHAGLLTGAQLARAKTTLGSLVRPFLPPTATPRPDLGRWRYVSLDEDSGYGISADQCREALEQAGVDVVAEPYRPSPVGPLGYRPGVPLGGSEAADVVVAHIVPEYLAAIADRHPQALLVANTTWETDHPPAHWGGCLDRADLIVTQSRFSARSLGRSTKRPIAVVPFPAPTPTGGPSSAWDWIPSDVTVFYTIAEWNARKAVDRTVAAFLRAFDDNDPVLLIVKTSSVDRSFAQPHGNGRAGPGTTAWSLAATMAGRADPPSISLDTRHLAAVDIEALHRRGDCFVSLARGEGWGMGAFAAATVGNPVVATGYGGHLDYLGGSPGLVDYRLVPVADTAGIASYSPDQRWAEADLDHAAQLLRSVITDPVHRQWATERAGVIRSRYRPEVVARATIDAVEAARRGELIAEPATTGMRWLTFGPGSGYGDAAEALMMGLRSAGVPITWSPLGWGENAWGTDELGPLIDPGPLDGAHADVAGLDIAYDTLVLHSSPTWNGWLQRQADLGRRMVVSTTWETDRLTAGQEALLNRFDLVVVPSRFNAETFMAAGVTAPIVTVPHIARPPGSAPPPPPTGHLRFYTIATWTARKALEETIAAFAATFGPKDDVSLLVCTTAEDHIALARMSRRGWAIDPSEGQSWFTLDRLLGADDDHPRIEIRTRPMTREEVDEVHRTSHCFVSLSRGEGWGLGAFDAAALGNPVVVTGWAGALDYLPEDYPFLVDFDLIPSSDDEPDNWMPASPGRWAKARLEHASSLLRSVHEDREAAWSVASRVASAIRHRFDARSVTDGFLDALARLPTRKNGQEPSTSGLTAREDVRP